MQSPLHIVRCGAYFRGSWSRRGVTHDAVRRYDPHHLILGDRWEANAPLPEEVVRAALPHVDVLSFQCFGTVDNIARKMRQWADFAKRPVLLADSPGGGR